PMWERTTRGKDGFYWPTPQARAGVDCPGERNRNTPNLAACVNMWATPAASQAHKKIRAFAPSESAGTHGEMTVGQMGERYPETIGGYLNPMWVEWLMGYPSGWTACEPWVMPS